MPIARNTASQGNSVPRAASSAANGIPRTAFSPATLFPAPPTDETSLDEVGRAFEFLTFLDVKPEAEIPGQALGEARFELTDNLAIVVRPRKEGETIWITLAAEGDDEATRLNARWRGWAYQVGPWKEKSFVPLIADLRRQEETPPPAAETTADDAPAAAPPPADGSTPAATDAPPRPQ